MVKQQSKTQFTQFRGTLIRRPFPEKPSIAQAQMLPLSSDSDFEVFTGFNSATCPVLLNVREHYQLLSDLVDEALATWPDIFILIRISMPGGMRIPARLLSDNVLLLEDINAEEQKLIGIAPGLLVIEDRFSRVEIDNNDNSIHLRLHLNQEPGKGKGQSEQPLHALVNCLTQRGISG